ncbi:hypothetical protein CYMTET_49887 [Cymbomonas tetramitiformis]|uniref:Uncharacterized protein n=1 Tax=Cymbomonas tetramitiformis TaxID=36881 RepID=A0AAE0EU96_9CHLO|nr:hypothetical protein CYMTET_49887 [Cymbomonas tetramitiformis]
MEILIYLVWYLGRMRRPRNWNDLSSAVEWKARLKYLGGSPFHLRQLLPLYYQKQASGLRFKNYRVVHLS